MIAPTTQPRMAWGPPMAAMISGIVMNGPIPTIWAMFSAVAGNSPSARMNPRSPVSAGAVPGALFCSFVLIRATLEHL